jgi:hypothetical protein
MAAPPPQPPLGRLAWPSGRDAHSCLVESCGAREDHQGVVQMLGAPPCPRPSRSLTERTSLASTSPLFDTSRREVEEGKVVPLPVGWTRGSMKCWRGEAVPVAVLGKMAASLEGRQWPLLVGQRDGRKMGNGNFIFNWANKWATVHTLASLPYKWVIPVSFRVSSCSIYF